MHELMPLASLSVGATAVVGQLVGRIEQIHRLREMGLRDGVRVEMLHAGKPCIIRIGGHKLCFRDSETMAVLVRPDVAARAG